MLSVIQVEKYQGTRTIDDMEAFIYERLADTTEKMTTEETTPEEPPVVPLFGDTFKDGIATGFTFIKYFAPW